MIKYLLNISEKALFTALGHIEKKLCTDHPLKNPPTFIIGPPRCGTTLLGQMVSHCFEVAYITNLAIRMRHTYKVLPPIVSACKLSKLLGYTQNAEEKYESNYGATSLPGGSSDSDFIWRDILPDGYLKKNALPPHLQSYLHRITAGIEKTFNRPFIDKCVGHSLRIPALLEVFPDALFIRCRRNPLAVAQSVYFGRTRNEWTRKTWLTPHTRGYKELLKKDILEQCAHQQYLFDMDIDSGLSQLKSERILEVDYNNVCTQPDAELKRISVFLQHQGISLKTHHKVPESFPLSNVRKVDKEIYDILVDHLEHIYKTPVSHLLEPE